MQHDLAVAIAVRILDNYYPNGDYCGNELQQLVQIIREAIKDQQNKVGSYNFID